MYEDEVMNVETAEEDAPKKRRGGRRPKADVSGTPEKKPEQIYIQFQDTEIEIDALKEAVRAAFREEKKRTAIKDLKLYIKPEEKTAYYVINEKFAGKVDY